MGLTIERILQDARPSCSGGADAAPYHMAYREYLRFFAERETITPHDFIIGASFVGAWVPSQVHLEGNDATFAHCASLLGHARCGTQLTEDGLQVLKCAIRTRNGPSMVAASKLLHFAAPRHYPMWDSKVVDYLNQWTDRGSRLDQRLPAHYLKYVDECLRITQDPRFSSTHALINAGVRYEVSALRALELIMFGAPQTPGKDD